MMAQEAPTGTSAPRLRGLDARTIERWEAGVAEVPVGFASTIISCFAMRARFDSINKPEFYENCLTI